MEKKLLEEITRIQEIMGIKLILEGVGGKISDFLTSVIKRSSDDSSIVQSLKNSIQDQGKTAADAINILDDLASGAKTIDDFPDINWKNVVSDMYETGSEKFKNIIRQEIAAHLDEGVKDVIDSVENITSNTDFDNLRKTDLAAYNDIIEELELSKKLIDDAFIDDPELGAIIKANSGLDKIPTLVVKPFKDIEISLITSLKNQNLEISKKFRNKWFSMMKKVENRKGEPWKATDEEKEKLSTILSAINEKTKGDKIYFTLPVSGKTVKIQPQEILNTQLSNYKLIYNKDGSISSLNKIDTHTQDSVDLFFDYINRQSDGEEIVKIINEQMEKGETTKIEEVLSKMESDDSFWDDIIENGDDVTKKIAETTATGTAREQLVASNAKKLFGDDWEVEFQAYEGHPLDRLLGVDLVLKNAAGEYKFVQVKSVNSVNVYETNFGVVAKMYNKNLKLQKPSQLDNIVYASPKNEVVVASKNRILKYSKELQDLIPTDKVGFSGPNMYGYSELIADSYVVIEDSPKGTILVKTK